MAHVTIPAEDPFIAYTGDGVTVAFPVPFTFFDAADITVYLDGVEQGSGYSVSGDPLDGGFQDGTVTFVSAPGAGVAVVLVRRLDVERVTDFPYPSQVLDIQSLNSELDRLVAMLQGIGLDSRRALRVPASEITVNELPGRAARANKVLAFDGDGQPIGLTVSLGGDISQGLIEQIINNALANVFPPGIIVAWSGSVGSIPAGWALCDGTNGTPNLGNRFVLGAGTGLYPAPHTIGGDFSGITSAAGAHNHGGSTGSHTLTTGEIPAHSHGVTDPQHTHGGSGVAFTPTAADGLAGLEYGTVEVAGEGWTWSTSGAINPAATGISIQNAGGGGGHAHTIPTQGDHAHTIPIVPPYYALCYIMRIGAWTGGGGEWIVKPEVIQFAVSDETTEITDGPAKITFRMPFAMTLQAVRASLGVASTSGAVTIDINQNGASILSTLLTIDEGEKTSTTAATPAAIGTTALADDAEITIDIDAAGADAAGLKVALIGVRV
ncbi:hypothetical protein [Neoroseomonas eburnea]|uniref:hypothetical protein n=1 Tax=Neoroseomonas eburnea TaxID=1346889 RepID=UPI001BA488CD|nr:hypothetical protein [Neoroseomonas eburnea]